MIQRVLVGLASKNKFLSSKMMNKRVKQKSSKITMNGCLNARNTCTILRYILHVDLFLGHNFCVLSQNDSRFIAKVLMTITHLA